MQDYEAWVRGSQMVRAYAAYDRAHTHTTGKVVAYQPSPVLRIETPSGDQVTWAAHLCEPLPTPAAAGPCGLCAGVLPALDSPANLCREHRAQFDAWLEREYPNG